MIKDPDSWIKYLPPVDRTDRPSWIQLITGGGWPSATHGSLASSPSDTVRKRSLSDIEGGTKKQNRKSSKALSIKFSWYCDNFVGTKFLFIVQFLKWLIITDSAASSQLSSTSAAASSQATVLTVNNYLHVDRSLASIIFCNARICSCIFNTKQK